jgi:hypothetical protein
MEKKSGCALIEAANGTRIKCFLFSFTSIQQSHLPHFVMCIQNEIAQANLMKRHQINKKTSVSKSQTLARRSFKRHLSGNDKQRFEKSRDAKATILL